MNPLIIAATEDTPEIIFNPKSNVFKLSHISLPENAIDFYKPVISWLKEYRNHTLPETIFDFNIEYMNTASSKQVFEIVFIIDKMDREGDGKMKIRWHYDMLDEDMQSLGLRFRKLVNVNFELVEYESDGDDIDFL